MGIRGKVSRNTLVHANEKRGWRIYTDFAQVLIHTSRGLYAEEEFDVELQETVYTLDSTTIDLCLSFFPWAVFRKHKAAIKLHTLLDLRGSIPSFIKITEGKVHDVIILDELISDPDVFTSWIEDIWTLPGFIFFISARPFSSYAPDPILSLAGFIPIRWIN